MELLLYYTTLFLVSFLSTSWVFKKVLKIAKLKNLVDNPDARKLQRVPVPVLGGIAVFFGIIIALAACELVANISNSFVLIFVMTIMLYIGTMDDMIGLSPLTRFIVEIFVVLILILVSGGSINDFHGLWGIERISDWIAIPLTVFACVGIINAINMIDGVNGLCSGYCMVTCLIFATAFLLSGDLSLASLGVLAVGALLPFFLHNVFGAKSKMFLGDGGSLLMGAIMTFFVINILRTDSSVASNSASNFGVVPFTLAILAIPVFDTLRVMISRILKRKSPFQPDNTHLHHLLFNLHFSHIGVTVTEILANLFVLGGWYLSYRFGASVDIQLYVVIFLGCIITFGLYGFGREQERSKSKVHHWITRIGDKTHVGHTKWFENLTRRLDMNC